MDTQIQKGLRAFLLGGLISCGLFYQQAQAAQINGDIIFTGTVTLDPPGSSAGNATGVHAWSGIGGVGSPVVQMDGADGDFQASGVNSGDAVTFHAPWSFNSGPISSFWSVDGFTFDLTSSSITLPRPSNAVAVVGVGTVSGHGFDPTPGTFQFTTQDPSADALFSFSAASSAVPEPMTMISVLSGSSLLGALMFIRRRRV